MKYYLILSLALLQAIPSYCNPTGKSRNTTEYKWAQTKLYCKRFKCPPVEDLVCVRIRSKKLGSKTKDIYMLLINKCEMEYLKCYQGYQAAEVPMKNCGNHDKLGHSGKRLKRSVRRGFRKAIKREQIDITSSGTVNAMLVGAAKETHPFKTSDTEEKEPEEKLSQWTVKTEDDADDKARIYEIDNVGKEIEAKPNPEEKQGGDADNQNDKGNDQIEQDKDIKEDDQNEEDKNGDDDVDVTTDVNGVSNDFTKHSDEETETTDAADTEVTDNPNEDNDGSDKKNVDAQVPNDYDLNAANEGVDFEEYEKDCPSKCPAREVMICARCHDGIYRTFMSSCHLRMFNCDHPDEKTELVSRLPCVLSAPYLAEVASPQGRVAEPGDVDEVLKFIRCREKKELGRDDPKCNIYNDNRKKKQLRN